MTSKLASAASILAALILSACGGPEPAPASLKSVLLVTVDTFRPDYMSMNGHPQPTTPFLDRLLGEGVYFERAITPIPRTTPALASLLTGAYPHTTGVRTLTSRLQPSVTTLGEVLQAHGYQTRAVVTNHMMGPARGLGRGFQTYLFSPKIPAAPTVTNVALRQLESLDPSQPFLLWVHYLDPHIPYAPPEALLEQFDPGYDGPYRESFMLKTKVGVDEERGARIHRNALPEPVNVHIRRLHAAMYRYFDDGLAPLVERARELYGNELLIVFAADHGESLGEHDFYWDHGDYVYNASMRVPLGFVFPPSHALHGGRRRTDAASLIDVTPTILDLLGIPMPDALREQVEGASLVPAIRGEAPTERALFAESGFAYYPELVKRRVRNDVAGRFRAVVLGDWKLIWTPFQTGDQEWELYDIASDPNETANLFDSDRPEVAKLRAHLEAWLQGSFLDDKPTLEGEDLEALKAMGYVR